MSAAELTEAVPRHRRGARLPVALTFDDDVRSHVDVAAPLLLTLGLPATFFLCGSALTQPRSFWWERLERAIERGAAPGDTVPSGVAPELDPLLATQPTLAELRGAIATLRTSGVRPSTRRCSRRPVRIRRTPVSAPLTFARSPAGFEIGFHTRRHPFCRCSTTAADARGHEGRAELEAAAGAPLEAVAYPRSRPTIVSPRGT